MQGVTYADGWSSWQSDQYGDGIVPIWSADLANEYRDKTFYYNGNTSKVNHTDLVVSYEVIRFIKSIVENISCDNFTYIEEEYSME